MNFQDFTSYSPVLSTEREFTTLALFSKIKIIAIRIQGMVILSFKEIKEIRYCKKKVTVNTYLQRISHCTNLQVFDRQKAGIIPYFCEKSVKVR